jgi:hypothetical protein
MKLLLGIAMSVILFAPATANAVGCSQPLSNGPLPVATDCLYILRAAVELEFPDPECFAAPTGTLPIKATDALVCLNAVVGLPVDLNCPCGDVGGDDDNDGLPNGDDPCPSDPLNRCVGDVAVDADTGRPVRINGINPIDPNNACRGQRIDCNGDVWEADYNYNHQSAAFECDLADCTIGGIDQIFGCSDENTADLFRCEHFSAPEYGDVAYSFAIPNGSYVVNMLFANIYSGTTDIGDRVFDVAFEGAVGLDNVDPVAIAGASGVASVRSAIVDVVDGDGLQIEFLREVQNPTFSGLEVLAITN